MLTAFENHLPRRLRFGRGVSRELAGELARLGRSRPLLISDAGVHRAGLVDQVGGALAAAGLPVVHFWGVDPEPPFRAVTAAVAAARNGDGIDVVVALGGGSVMDTAKVVAATFPSFACQRRREPVPRPLR